MVEDSIEDTRRDARAEIKEKVKKNPGYLHPCNKERLKDMERLEFKNGYDFTCWMQQNGIMKNPYDINRKDLDVKLKNANCKTEYEYQNKCAQKLGYDRQVDRTKEKRWNRGECSPMSENENCNLYFGVYIAQNYIMKLFEDPIPTPHGTKGVDWICKNGKKIEHKASCLRYDKYGNTKFVFPIEYNNRADYFILSGWDNRESLQPMYVWMFHKNDMIRYGYGNIKEKFWRRESFSITNKPRYLKEFETHELKDKLDRLKELCKDKDDN